MKSLEDLGPFETEYSSDENDIANDFVNPCLTVSNRYDRITGFFASSVFLLTFTALRSFILDNEGQIRIICSPRVAERDARGIAYGYERRGESALAESLTGELQKLLTNAELVEPTRLLAVLISTGRLDVRVAEVAESAERSLKRMFHDKVGLFRDRADAAVGFRGSMNETFLGLSAAGNIESVDVWPSWLDGRDAERVVRARARFERIWSGEAKGVTVTRLPSETIAALELIAEDISIEEAIGALESRLSDAHKSERFTEIRLRDHQSAALEAWRDNLHRGILRHATGAGKTLSGIFAAKEALTVGLAPVIVVPSVELLRQWATEVKAVLKCPLVLCGGGHTNWRERNLVKAVVESGSPEHCILAVDATAASSAFGSQLQGNEESLFLLMDEVHNAGSTQNRMALEALAPAWRMGLSATPERAGDHEGTAFIFDYFGGVVHEYNLDAAIADGVLVPYTYDPFFVHLSAAEQESWDEISTRISQIVAMLDSPNPPAYAEQRLNLLRIQRARIAKSASDKILKAVQVVTEHFEPSMGQKWLIYCDNLVQLQSVREALGDVGIRSWEFHSQMEGDRNATLGAFEEQGGIVVAIKCLDEGVDIPSATHALILASSRNPREFIQRRGRVLRRAPGKAMAHIRDAIVLPAEGANAAASDSLVSGELARAIAFSQSSLSPHTMTRLEAKWVDLGNDMAEWSGLARSGFEAENEINDEDDANA